MDNNAVAIGTQNEVPDVQPSRNVSESPTEEQKQEDVNVKSSENKAEKPQQTPQDDGKTEMSPNELARSAELSKRNKQLAEEKQRLAEQLEQLQQGIQNGQVSKDEYAAYQARVASEQAKSVEEKFEWSEATRKYDFLDKDSPNYDRDLEDAVYSQAKYERDVMGNDVSFTDIASRIDKLVKKAQSKGIAVAQDEVNKGNLAEQPAPTKAETKPVDESGEVREKFFKHGGLQNLQSLLRSQMPES